MSKQSKPNWFWNQNKSCPCIKEMCTRSIR